MTTFLCDCFVSLRRRVFLISWISLVIYIFYDTFLYYYKDRRFYHLRGILGSGLCISRGTANVLNLCCALVLLPLCKKLNQLLYRILSKLWPGLFFFWLERAKSFHMTVAITLLIFAVIHSLSHFVNLWNFSRNYDEHRADINMARYKNENPLRLLMSTAGLTGVMLLTISISMGLTSLRIVRRRIYNAFWYTHQLYLPFMVFLMIHPLSGVLKQEVLDEHNTSLFPSQMKSWTNSSTLYTPKFVAIKSKTWLWMALPLSCFLVDLLWRIFSRNRARVQLLNILCHLLHEYYAICILVITVALMRCFDRGRTMHVGASVVLHMVTHMPGRTLSVTVSCPHEWFNCRKGQYILLQCLDVSLLEWHPFTVVKLPTPNYRQLDVWIRVKGDWTEAFERLILEKGATNVRVLIDGPFSSPMEGVSRSDIALCVAAGVGITPFVTILYDMLINPRGFSPRRVHLMWIVRQGQEITWLAELTNKVLSELRYANRPDRLHIEFYVTSTNDNKSKNPIDKDKNDLAHVIVINEKGALTHVLKKSYKTLHDEKATLLTPIRKVNDYVEVKRDLDNKGENYDIAKEYPLLGCRVRRGRPHWDRVFGYWVHLYPEQNLSLYCCGPKKLVKLLRDRCKSVSNDTKTKFAFIHEAFS